MVPDASPDANLLSVPAKCSNPQQAAWQAIADLAKALHGLAIANMAKDVSCPTPPPLPLQIQHSPVTVHRDNSVSDDTTLAEAINALLTVKASGARSDRYLDQLRYTLSAFSKNRSRRPINSFTTEELETWLNTMGGAARSRKGRILYLRLLFLFSKKRGWVGNNPAEALELPAKDPPKIGIHTPDQVKKILSEAMRQNPGVARALAIRYFAGIRSAELVRMGPEHILSERGFIVVPAKASKTRRRRLVKILPNLAQWIAATPEIPGNLFERVEKVWKAAGVPWPNNVTRHSFVSYHLGMFENAGKTALEAGHSETMLFSNYRELVTPDDAKAYWNILPETKSPQGETPGA